MAVMTKGYGRAAQCITALALPNPSDRRYRSRPELDAGSGLPLVVHWCNEEKGRAANRHTGGVESLPTPLAFDRHIAFGDIRLTQCAWCALKRSAMIRSSAGSV